jgi:hypothetical protein
MQVFRLLSTGRTGTKGEYQVAENQYLFFGKLWEACVYLCVRCYLIEHLNNLDTAIRMYSYKDISNELITNAKIAKEDIFEYDYSPLKEIFERYFQFCQTNLSEYSNEHNIQPAKFYYVERNGVNAIAGIRNSYYIIGVYKATITSLYDLFYEQNNIFDDDAELKHYSNLNSTLNVPLGFFNVPNSFPFHLLP